MSSNRLPTPGIFAAIVYVRVAAILLTLAALAVSKAQITTHSKKRTRTVASRAIPRQNILRGTAPASGAIQVDLNSADVLNRFTPELALGGAVDAIGIGGLPTLFSTSNVSTILSAGEQTMSYRLYTELNVQDWHWNPRGTWSDSANQKGYFVGSASIAAPIQHSYGFQLLHRGDTFDPGDNQDYSRITDGNSSTFWKSNPYLTSTYTGDPDSAHPQWVVLDLVNDVNVDAIQIKWANPYAVKFTVQYWVGDDAMFSPETGQWVTFPSGTVTAGTGGTTTLRLSTSPISAEYIRVLMTQSSNTAGTDGSDPRSAMGYAIDEIGVGTLNASGKFTDLVTHSADQNQTAVYVSSTDPFHTASAQNPGAEQVGLDYILSGNLSQRLPAMIPVPMFYSTPENAINEITYLSWKRYEIAGIELGEEPDGQFAMPEDYASLFIQWATRIHNAFPRYKLGGPVSSSFFTQTWADANGKTDWMTRFVAYLTSHNALSLLSFVSTEHYPFTDTTANWSELAAEPGAVADLFQEMNTAAVPSTTPLYVTEYNFNAGTSEVPVDLMGAVWHSIFVGEFMNRGGAGSYYYQYLPVQLENSGSVWGIIGMFTGDTNDQIQAKTAQYFSSQLICQQWCQPGRLQHTVLPAKSNITDTGGNPLVLPYAVLRPDGQYALLLANTDSVAHTVSVTFSDTASHYFTGQVTQVQLSSANYKWVPNGANGTAKPDGPLVTSTVASGSTATYTLPAESITVLRGTIK